MKSYAKRNVINNWQKYEETANDDELVRGKIFDLAIASASGGADSHFRLEDEQTWKDEEFSNDDEAVKIDCNSLKSSLNCLILPVQLDCPKDIFTEDELQLFEDNAQTSRSSYATGKDNVVRISELHNATERHSILNKLKDESRENTKELENIADQEIDLLLSLDSQNTDVLRTKKNDRMPPSNEDSEIKDESNNSLEDWLDDILND
ncbi:Cell death regulator Aven [Nymphon striatum]|nr:Cell death regulator Aven [Nymphon striatum]